MAFLVQALWWAPYHAWLLLASSFARRAPFLWAVFLPAVVVLAELYLNYTWNTATIIAERIGGGVIPLSVVVGDRVQLGIMSINSERATLDIDMAAVWQLLTSADMFWGWVVAAVFIAGAVWMRRYRDET